MPLGGSERLAGNGEDGRDDGDQDKGEPPRDLSEQPAEDRRKHQARRLSGCERPHRPAEHAGRHDLGERRQQDGGEERVRAAHCGAGYEERPDVRRKSAADGGDAEREVGAPHDPRRPQPLGERARDQLEQGERNHVRGDRRGDLRDRGIEPCGDVGNERHEHRTAEGSQESADVEGERDPAHAAEG